MDTVRDSYGLVVMDGWTGGMGGGRAVRCGTVLTILQHLECAMAEPQPKAPRVDSSGRRPGVGVRRACYRPPQTRPRARFAGSGLLPPTGTENRGGSSDGGTKVLEVGIFPLSILAPVPRRWCYLSPITISIAVQLPGQIHHHRRIPAQPYNSAVHQSMYSPQHPPHTLGIGTRWLGGCVF